MKLHRWTCLFALAAGCCATWVAPVSAVILLNNPVRNLSAPSGRLTDSGWQWQGNFRNFAATPVSKKFFVTAGHIGGGVGDRMRVGGRVFTTVRYWDDPNSDLRLYEVNKSFSSWAPMYTGRKEAGKHALIFGRGTQRGPEVSVNGRVGGWEWGGGDGQLSWGLNVIDAVVPGEQGEGDLLQFDFDSIAGGAIEQEGTLSIGDSAGGAFFWNRDLKRWELAGLHYSVDGPFSRTPGGQSFQAAMFDMGGLYYGDSLVADSSVDVPQRFYATRISSNMNWIMSVFRGQIAPTQSAQSISSGKSSVPEPSSVGAMVLAAGLLSRRVRRARNG